MAVSFSDPSSPILACGRSSSPFCRRAHVSAHTRDSRSRQDRQARPCSVPAQRSAPSSLSPCHIDRRVLVLSRRRGSCCIFRSSHLFLVSSCLVDCWLVRLLF